ncbi:hypothetical protein C8J57DRAFT_1491387 [Mycena rebaudengoi]|nr:hypothetical protein C8J57DRAFT_1491387 [Mycena rebaudengoi]
MARGRKPLDPEQKQAGRQAAVKRYAEKASDELKAQAARQAKAAAKKPYIFAPGPANPTLPTFIRGRVHALMPQPPTTPPPARDVAPSAPPPLNPKPKIRAERAEPESSEVESDSTSESADGYGGWESGEESRSRKRSELSGVARWGFGYHAPGRRHITPPHAQEGEAASTSARCNIVLPHPMPSTPRGMELIMSWAPYAQIRCVSEYHPHPQDNHSIKQHGDDPQSFFYGVTRGRVLGVYTRLEDAQRTTNISGGTYFVAANWAVVSRMWEGFCAENHSHEHPSFDSPPESPSALTVSRPSTPPPAARSACVKVPLAPRISPAATKSAPSTPRVRPAAPTSPPPSPTKRSTTAAPLLPRREMFLQTSEERIMGIAAPMPPAPPARPAAVTSVMVYAVSGHPVAYSNWHTAFAVFQRAEEGELLATTSPEALCAFMAQPRAPSSAPIAYAVSGQGLVFKSINSALLALQQVVDGEILFTNSASELWAFLQK